MIIIEIIEAVVKGVIYLATRPLVWRERRKYIEEHQEYIDQLEKMDGLYKPESIDVELANRCREYLFTVFPYGIREKIQGMSQEELIEFFKQVEKDAEEIMDVRVDNVNFYATDEEPECRYCGCYNHDSNSLNINAAFILRGGPELVEEQIYTIFHELKHARQWAAVLKEKDYGYSDAQLEAWGENMLNYIPTFVSDELYRKQPLEVDTFGFESILKGERKLETV